MIFTNSRTNKQSSSSSSSSSKTKIPYVKPRPLPVKMNVSETKITNITNKNVHGSSMTKVEWGPIIWYFFHILAEKVHESTFHVIREKLLTHIHSICYNLPCPTCSDHAKRYLMNINYNSIRTKEDLKMFFLNFHNEVNKRLSKSEFTYSELNEKYSKGRLNQIIPLFFKVFEGKHKTVNMLSNDMYTQRISTQIKKWLSENVDYFTFN